MTLTRAKFNELTADLVDRTMGPVRKALQDAGLRPSDLKKVLMSVVPPVSPLSTMQSRRN